MTNIQLTTNQKCFLLLYFFTNDQAQSISLASKYDARVFNDSCSFNVGQGLDR
mgnify:CR=1 FL=1